MYVCMYICTSYVRMYVCMYYICNVIGRHEPEASPLILPPPPPPPSPPSVAREGGAAWGGHLHQVATRAIVARFKPCEKEEDTHTSS